MSLRGAKLKNPASVALRQVEQLRLRLSQRGFTEPQVDELVRGVAVALRELQASSEELDVQDEKQRLALERLADEHERYRELWETALDCYLVTDLQGIVRDANKTATDTFGVRLQTLRGKPLAVFVPVEIRAPFRSLINQAAAVASQVHIVETPMIGRTGGRFPAVVRVARATSAGDPVPELRWAIRNVALQKASQPREEEAGARDRIEDVLRGSDSRYRQLVEHAADIVYELDSEGRFTFCNARAVQRTLGYEPADLLGRRITELVPAGYRDAVLKFAQHAERAGPSNYFEFPILTKDQRTVWLGQHGVSVAASGENRVVRAICRDVTAKVELVNQLQSAGERTRSWSTYLQAKIEAERARIAQDIHDELGASLTSIRMELAMSAAGDGARKTNYRRRDTRLVRRIDAALDTMRRICSDLRPSLLDNMGLCAAIEWLCQDMQRRTDIRCTTILKGMAFELEAQRSITVFRIVQEAITNVIRHAKASEMTVTQDCAGGTILVSVADNGVGIDPASHAGLQSFGLVGMQERARAFGGRVSIEARSGGGTVVTARMPMRGPAKLEAKLDESVASR